MDHFGVTFRDTLWRGEQTPRQVVIFPYYNDKNQEVFQKLKLDELVR